MYSIYLVAFLDATVMDNFDKYFRDTGTVRWFVVHVNDFSKV